MCFFIFIKTPFDINNNNSYNIVIHNLGDGVRSITQWLKLLMDPCKVFLFKKPSLVPQLNIMWNLVLIMAFLALSIVFLQDIMDLLVDVLNSFNKFGSFFSFRLNMFIFFLYSCKGKCDINETQQLKSQAHLKVVLAN